MKFLGMSRALRIALISKCALGVPMIACASEPSVRIELVPQATEIALLEALAVSVTIENIGNVPAQLYVNMFSEEKVGSVTVKRLGNPAIELTRPAYVGLHAGSRYETLGPGETYRTSFLLCCNWENHEGSVFNKRGQFEIVVRYVDEVIAVQSDPVRVTVVRPPTTEMKALKLVEALRSPEALYEPDLISPDHEAEVLAELREIANVEESVVYANYARAALAWRHVRAAQIASKWPDLYDQTQELEAAESLLKAIRNEEFVLSGKVQSLRQQLEAMKGSRKKNAGASG